MYITFNNLIWDIYIYIYGRGLPCRGLRPERRRKILGRGGRRPDRKTLGIGGGI